MQKHIAQARTDIHEDCERLVDDIDDHWRVDHQTPGHKLLHHDTGMVQKRAWLGKMCRVMDRRFTRLGDQRVKASEVPAAVYANAICS